MDKEFPNGNPIPSQFPGLLPMSIGMRGCVSTDHVHFVYGVMSVVPPLPGEVVFINEDEGEFFYPFKEEVLCLN